MAIKEFLQSRRLLLGALTASLGLASAAAPVVSAQASAQPVEGPGPIQPSTISAPGTYEDCTPYFGLMKDNADLLSFDVVNVNNAVSPTPVIGTDIVPVLTVTDGTQSIECIPSLGWTDEATWQSDYVHPGSGFVITGLVAYPGAGYYLMPAVDGTTAFSLSGGGSILPTASSLRFETNFVGLTLTVTPPALVHTFGGYLPLLQSLTSAQISDPYYAAASAVVTAAGDAAQAAYLLELLTAGPETFCDNTTWEPLVPDQNYLRLIATMQSLLQTVVTTVNCWGIAHGAEVLYNVEVQNAKIPNSLVTLTITDPNATTTPLADQAPSFTG